MIKNLKGGEVRKILPRRDKMSHKGMNGKVMVVGGSKDYYGAPILSGLGALYSGADLVYLFVPECNFDVSRSMYPDFIVKPLPGDYLDMKSVTPILDFAMECDSILLGPGVGNKRQTMEALIKIVSGLEIPTVLDSKAIQVFQDIKEVPSQHIAITPHHAEFETLTGKEIRVTGSVSQKVVLVRTLATDLKINILLKGPEDIVASEEGEMVANATGNSGMTVGGSGDVLSGLVASFMAQGLTGYDACQTAAFICGKVGDELMKTKGFSYSASDIALEIPYIIRQMTI
ncbi:NAD(P)H-hydrate dehydratase [Candidatus Peregrinibacteria bacterium]|nr:NAD(P)H-hydrate dehydratase [Candidatus Peregrinibacteria bacterium]